MDEKKVWGIHTTDDNLFLSKNIIAIGWHEFGDLAKVDADRESFKKHFVEVFPNAKKGQVPTSAGMLFRFIHEVQIGDYIIFPSKQDRKINIGEIIGDYYFDDSDGRYVQRRKVKWLKHIPRTSFSQGALYEVGSAMTFFSVKNYADEFLAALNQSFRGIISESNDYESVASTAGEIRESTKDFIIKELSRNLKGFAFEEFVADLLDAMGYRTKVSPQGGDSGIDIVAYKDELPPRILVQVKSGDNAIRETTIQSLRGAMKEGDYGLFVTLSDYTKKAKKYLELTPIIRGIDGTELINLVLENYEKLSEKHKKIIPLEKVYIPVSREAVED